MRKKVVKAAKVMMSDEQKKNVCKFVMNLKQHPVYSFIWCSEDGRVFTTRNSITWNNGGIREIGCSGSGPYVYVTLPNTSSTAHRLVWETFRGIPKKGEDVDHIDNDKKNNALSNLRVLPHGQNVCRRKTKDYVKVKNMKKCWRVGFHFQDKKSYYAFFYTEAEAKQHADEKRIEFFGKLAWNHPDYLVP